MLQHRGYRPHRHNGAAAHTHTRTHTHTVSCLSAVSLPFPTEQQTLGAIKSIFLNHFTDVRRQSAKLP